MAATLLAADPTTGRINATIQAARDRLEAEITELWGHLNAATYRFLVLVAEFDRARGYQCHGLVNTAQWLNWQCGIGGVAAREKVRVARSLEGLPLISAAFARGQISYSKVRAMTRVATAANEEVLLNVATHGTAAHVERLVRKYRWTERREAAARAMAQHQDRALDSFYDDTGAFVLQARLPAELGAIVRKALKAAIEELRESAVDADDGAASARDVSAETVHGFGTRQAAAERADALVRIAERSLAGDGRRVSTADRYQVVVHVDQALLAKTATDDREPHCCELDDDGPALAVDTARRLACDATLVGIVERDGEPLDVGRRTRAIPPALDRALRSRDGGCRFPGCTHTRFTEGHHVVHWADGGETKLDNLVTLCRFHHRLVHEGDFGLKATDDGLFLFTGPDGRRLPENGRPCFSGNNSSERGDADDSAGSFSGNTSSEAGANAGCFCGNSDQAIRRLNREAGLSIDPYTARSRWLGERFDVGIAVGSMLWRRNRAGGAATSELEPVG